MTPAVIRSRTKTICKLIGDLGAKLDQLQETCKHPGNAPTGNQKPYNGKLYIEYYCPDCRKMENVEGPAI